MNATPSATPPSAPTPVETALARRPQAGAAHAPTPPLQAALVLSARAATTSHQERVSLSPGALEQSRAQPDVPRSDVRWYRAVHFGSGARLAATGDAAGPDAAGSSAAAAPRAVDPRAAAAAYRELMGAS